VHGYGLFLMRSLLDEVRYEPQAGNNRWRLVKCLE
jgi:anti-sigma regulatory factor (Ser/Thr protein kinase)